MITFPCTVARFGLCLTMESGLQFRTEVSLHPPSFNPILLMFISTGAAYDTEKAFDNMFIADPSITELDGDWAYVKYPEKFRFCTHKCVIVGRST